MKKTLVIISIAAALFSLTANKAYAACESEYGGGETCIYNKSFRIEKEVRIEGDNEWKDKVTGVKPDEVVEFRIRVENVGEVEVDNMKMEDFLPDEMERVGGDGLTEYWNDFAPGDVETFKIKAIVKPDEYVNDTDFYKCVVNKAEITYDGAFEGSDTAIVCYGEEEITELPKTGVGSTITFGLLGATLISAGGLLKKSKKYAK